MQRILKTIHLPIHCTELHLEEDGENDSQDLQVVPQAVELRRVGGGWVVVYTCSLAPSSRQVLFWGLADPSL